MDFRTGDLAHFNRTVGQMTEVQSRLRHNNLKIATGKEVHRYQDLGGKSGVLMRTETALVQTQTFQEQNQLLLQRLNLMDGAIEEIKDIASSLQTALIARRNDSTGASTPLDLEAQGMIERMTAKLNHKIDGRYAFAGSRTETPPVAAAALTDDPSNTDYYQGDQVDLSARIDVRIEAHYGVRADAEPFARLFAALQLATDGHVTDDDAKLQAAAKEAEQALDGIISLRSELNTVTARVQSAVDSQEGTALYLKETVSLLIDTDVPTAMAQIAQDQVSLEGSFATMAQLNRLSLTEYLR